MLVQVDFALNALNFLQKLMNLDHEEGDSPSETDEFEEEQVQPPKNSTRAAKKTLKAGPSIWK